MFELKKIITGSCVVLLLVAVVLIGWRRNTAGQLRQAAELKMKAVNNANDLLSRIIVQKDHRPGIYRVLFPGWRSIGQQHKPVKEDHQLFTNKPVRHEAGN